MRGRSCSGSGQALSRQDLISRLNDLGYAQRDRADAPGEFSIERDAVAIKPRSSDLGDDVVRVSFGSGIRRLDVGRKRPESIQLDAPLLTALMSSGGRQKSRNVPLSTIPKYVQQAVLAIEDQGFYSHPGINPVRILAAAAANVFGDNPNLVGYSTITQQLARMFFLSNEFNAELSAGERSYGRKLREAIMSLVLERHASKDEILELYLNDIYLGQRGSFAIHGVAEAARLFFGKDVANISLSEAALIAGVIQSPATRSPFARPERAVERRNVVLQAMADEGYISREAADRCVARSAAGGRARRRQRSAVLRRHGERAGCAGVSGTDRGNGPGGRLHDARPQFAARGARRGTQRARQR